MLKLTLRSIQNGYILADENGAETHYMDTDALFRFLLELLEARSDDGTGLYYGSVHICREKPKDMPK